MCKTMNINPKYAAEWTRAFNSIRNRIVITVADLDRNLKVRVIGNGTPITRTSGLSVLLFNTNVMLGSDLAAAVARLKPEAFNAAVEEAAGDDAKVIQYLRDTQNLGNVPFSVPVTNRNIAEVGQGATADCTVAQIVIQSGPRAGEITLALNFNRVIPAVAGQKATSAFDALMGDVTGVGAASAPLTPSFDPFAPTINTDPFAGLTGNALKAAKKKAAAEAAAAV